MQVISHSQAREMMAALQGAFLLLDVRHEYEFEQSRIPGAILLDNDELDPIKGHPLLPEDLDYPIFIYCRSGRRSNVAARKLDILGYDNVYDFGGILTWPFEVEKG